MSTLQMVLAGTAAVLLLAWWWLRRPGPRARPGRDRADEDRLDTIAGWPPQATRVLSGPERQAHAMLSRALPDHLILAQVPVSRFVTVSKRNSYADWLRRVGYQCVDLVVCDRATQVVAAVELQPAQPSERARKRLLRMSRTLQAANLPLLVWQEDALPPFDTVRRAVLPDAEPVAPAPESAFSATAPTPFDDPHREPASDEATEWLEPPRSTWFDEIDSAKTPLGRR